MASLGLRGKFSALIKNYLHNRLFRIKFNDTYTDNKPASIKTFSKELRDAEGVEKTVVTLTQDNTTAIFRTAPTDYAPSGAVINY